MNRTHNFEFVKANLLQTWQLLSIIYAAYTNNTAYISQCKSDTNTLLQV